MTYVPATAIITCPHCAARRTEPLPADACLFFYQCTECGAILRPRAGDCCVFCSYADRRCPTSNAGSAPEETTGG
jgi:hypothetical protein